MIEVLNPAVKLKNQNHNQRTWLHQKEIEFLAELA